MSRFVPGTLADVFEREEAMQVKTHKMVKGIPAAEIATAPGVRDSGAPQVTCFVNAIDSYDQRAVVASLRMSPPEARDYAARLIDAADKAEAMARGVQGATT